MPTNRTLAFPVILISAASAAGAETDATVLEKRFDEVVRPFLKSNCLKCHGGEMPKGKLDLGVFGSTEEVVKGYRVWDLVAERLGAGEMPPEDASPKPSESDRRAILNWIKELRDREARRNAGDPGPVPARRLSNAEYDNSIRDLTGVDIRPTREFPIDPANEAGFDNSGETLTMSPALLKKYLDAARRVADHIVLKPRGFDFAPHPAVTDTDRDKYCVARIVAFYDSHRVDLADYFLADWRFRSRASLGKPNAAIGDFAREAGLSAKYLETIHATLDAFPLETGPFGELNALRKQLPTDVSKREEARRICERMWDLVVALRRAREPNVGRMEARGISPGSQPFVLWRNRKLASMRMSDASNSKAKDIEAFCRVFPDAFYVSDRPPYFDPRGGKSGRLLTAGFHLMQGYFRDDAPLRELVLNDAERLELDELWRELNFVALVPMRQYKDFIFFERAEPPRYMREALFDYARSEDKDAVSESKIRRLRGDYLEKARSIKVGEEQLDAIAFYFDEIAGEIRRVERDRLEAEPSHLEALAKFAERAYRRPLSKSERADLFAFYRELRDREGLSHEESIRDAVASILISPRFCYRIDPAEAGDASRPLSSGALASRLSYFLWASIPDEELLSRAASDELRDPAVLASQARRMLQDDRARGFATEFAGNWLGVRRFEEHNGVDRERFPAFTNELRRAMYEEPIRFFLDVARRNRSVLDLLDSDDAFVNSILAKHYGMPISGLDADDWIRVEGAKRYGRGGLPAMAVFLTANSPGARTSPVKRGYWVVRRLLGEHIPAPPPNVPELPKDEAKSGELSLPRLLARHREDKSCSGCHRRFDAIGLAFEGYGPIGERRERDLGGRPVETLAAFPEGDEGDGIDGLRKYLNERRRDEFVDNLCRKLFSYALGRSLLPSDDPTLGDVKKRLKADGYRFEGLIESIATSPQFSRKRGKDDPRD